MKNRIDVRDEIPIKRIDGDEIFGSENADLEDDHLFDSYSVDRDDFDKLYDKRRKICILFAYKGTGKSAALRLIRNRHKDDEGAIVTSMSAGDHAPKIDSADPSVWMAEWKRSILKHIASEIGTNIAIAYDDDATTLVQHAERQGFKKSNFVGYITKNLADKYQVSKTPELDIGLQKKVERYLSGRSILIWLLIDDIDLNFKADAASKAKVVGFVNAIKILGLQIPELRSRFAIRPNVWELLAEEFDSLNQMREYQVPIEWTEADIMQLLARRVSSFYQRSKSNMEQWIVHDKDQEWIRRIFEDPMLWGGRERPPHVVLDTLSRNRPRWLIELAKLSLKTARKSGHIYVKLSDLEAILPEFGAARITDTIAEFGSHCPDLKVLLACFREQEKTFTHDQLVGLINKLILPHVNPRIVGLKVKADSKDIIRFLYYIGFLSVRQEREDRSYEHILYASNPTFLAGNFDMKASFTWEVHPVFAEGLAMSNRRPLTGARSERMKAERNERHPGKWPPRL